MNTAVSISVSDISRRWSSAKSSNTPATVAICATAAPPMRFSLELIP